MRVNSKPFRREAEARSAIQLSGEGPHHCDQLMTLGAGADGSSTAWSCYDGGPRMCACVTSVGVAFAGTVRVQNWCRLTFCDERDVVFGPRPMFIFFSACLPSTLL